MTDIAAIILAAGRSSRFAGGEGAASKLVAELGGKPLARHVAEAALASRARPVVVVTGHQASAVRGALDGLDLAFAHNADYARGLSGSLRCGLAALPEASGGAVILLGDMPLVSAALIDRLIEAFARHRGNSPALAAAPVRAGRRGNPVLIGRALFPQVARLEGDAGAGALIDALQSRLVECPVEDDRALIDVDTQDALRRLDAG